MRIDAKPDVVWLKEGGSSMAPHAELFLRWHMNIIRQCLWFVIMARVSLSLVLQLQKACRRRSHMRMRLARKKFRPPSTTMPWTIWPALVVLWGVFWMFALYPNRHADVHNPESSSSNATELVWNPEWDTVFQAMYPELTQGKQLATPNMTRKAMSNRPSRATRSRRSHISAILE
jgi:hypothetical protein